MAPRVRPATTATVTADAAAAVLSEATIKAAAVLAEATTKASDTIATASTLAAETLKAGQSADHDLLIRIHEQVIGLIRTMGDSTAAHDARIRSLEAKPECVSLAEHTELMDDLTVRKANKAENHWVVPLIIAAAMGTPGAIAAVVLLASHPF